MEDQTNNRIREEIEEEFIDILECGKNLKGEEVWTDLEKMQWLRKKIDELLKSQREEIAKQFIEIEKDKWKDAEHCTCLGYAIVKIFGKKYEKILQDLTKEQ